MLTDKQLAGTGFKSPNPVKSRLILSVTGREKSGKTHFAMTAPGPIALISIDLGDEGVVQKFLDQGKQIVLSEYEVPEVKGGEKNEKAMMESCDAVWDKLVADYAWALKHCRTLVLDTGTEIWELLRLARFGRVAQIKPHHYVEVNREYREFVKDAYNSSCNLIILHKAKAVWIDVADGKGGVKGRKTGDYERAGFADTGFLVQTNIETYRIPRNEREDTDDGFRVKIVDCRQNANLDGEEFTTPMNTFPMLAQMILPSSDPSAWE